MRIGQLARSAGVNVETVRYYQRIGLIELPRKPYGGVRSYDNEYLRRLLFIRRAQKLGFSLEDVRALLDLSSADCQQVQKLRQLRDVESVLTKTIQQCGKRKAPESCPIIEALANQLDPP
jgi:MerR family mercuric resistance operon transcriptional regulator